MWHRRQGRAFSADVADGCEVEEVEAVLRGERLRLFRPIKEAGENTVLGDLERQDVEGRKETTW